ncbi:hypothetical protein PR202_ga30348 [Eleusine coracana subsp. coracana]|uniref:Uncharacterized protein n=1 Tax=Eleusine coracana subsp. coracana TaxID=191504 RepID=A0AAV5DPG6_ELECO|nr:hypothetical protein PR202_ga30348 [Eleusine coracana subsp. coracana]
MVPRRWASSSSASLVPRSKELGARPRPMGDKRWLHLVGHDECLLWLFSKPCGDGALSDLGLLVPGFGGVRWWPAGGGFGMQRLQGLARVLLFS